MLLLAHHLSSELSNVDATDPAAKFISSNALRDLKHFTFSRQEVAENANDIETTAFYVIDLNRNREVILDTSTCTGLPPKAPARRELLAALSEAVDDTGSCE